MGRAGRSPGIAMRVALWAAALGLLALVFTAYLSPHTVVDLANRVWACF